MIRVKWALEESVVLFDFYFKHNEATHPSKEELERLSEIYNKRADKLEILHDEKFRNVAGLSMQLACILYVVTDGQAGFSSASRVHYDAYRLFQNDKAKFEAIVKEFYEKYTV